ncbi:hypothetical protein P8452_46020 [Trifolium repens]|nr:hypothetical protein QL285_073878 [Trifolium repens]WJX60863.1 hypothetical protein P8452_46020 [Trifolium repens]
MAYSRSFMFLGVILFVILSTQVLAANHVPEPSITEPMASMKSRLMAEENTFISIYEQVIKILKKIMKNRNEKNKVFISGEENKIPKDDEEEQVSKNDVEDKVSLCDEEH